MKRLALLLSLLLCVPVFAQNSRGSINGQVTDPSGAVLPHVTVSVRDTDTGAVSNVTTTNDGYYSAPGLMPGPYEITVETKGFKTFTQSGIALATQENATVNIKLTVGSPTETMTVTSNAPLIDEEDASVGQVLSTEEVQDLPSDGRSPLGFARIEYGAVAKTKHALGGALPYNNSTVDDFSIGGGNSSSNELLLNGVPNMQDSSRTAGYSPNLDSVNEIRVDSFGANTTYGDTSGGTVNITTKSGTNSFHGTGSWFYQANGCSSQYGSTFTSRSANHCDWMTALPWNTPAGGPVPPAQHLNQFGGTLGGPLWIPHVFDGHNKLFFFYAYEGVVGAQPPAQTIGTVLTQAERGGDFSALLGLNNGKNYQLYNPYTASGTQTSYGRTPIPNNCLVATCNGLPGAGLTLSPIAQAYLKYIPLPTPNYNGPTTTADGENNYFTYTPSTADYHSHDGRIDFNLSSRDKMWGEAHRSRYITTASNYFHNASTGTKSDQIEAGGLVEEVHTFSPTLLLDVRGSVTRHDLTNFISSSGISPTSLGFPTYIAANSTAIAMPQISFSDQSSPLGLSGSPGSSANFDTVQLFATLTKVYRSHTFLGGVDIRAYKNSNLSPGAANGGYTFSSGIMSPGTSGTAAYFGGAFASFLLGIPSSGSYNIAAAFQFNSFLDGFFLQDNWKAKPNLTISYGVRFEHETPVVESQNRMVNGFNPTVVNEATLAAEANYAAKPSPLLAASAFQPTGGAIYASPGNRGAYNNPPLYVSPRLGISWAPEAWHEKGVVRIGYGIYDNPFNDYNTGQSYGYSQSTSYVQSANNGLTFNTLADPFPTSATAPGGPNPILQPTGNALGVNTNLGSKMVYYYPNLKVPYSERASLDIQYQIGKTILLEVGYLNNHQVHLSYSNAVDAIPLLPYLSRSPYFDLAVNNELTGTTFKTGGPPTTSIPNPFKGVAGITGSLATASTIAPTTYLMTNPEFTSVTEQLIPGSSSNYNALNVRATKLMGHGLTVNGIFEWSRQLGTFNQLNPGDVLNYGETTSDYPFHFAGYGTYQLPFGHGRQFFNSNRFVNPVIGGWQVSAIYQFVSGQPIPWGNVIYTGSGWKDFHNVQHSSANVLGQTVFNTAVFDTRTCQSGTTTKCQNDPSLAGFNPSIQPNAYNYRTFPAYLLRQDYTSNWDANVQKDTQLAEGVSLELRMEAFNLLNRPQYTTPNVSPTSAQFGTAYGVAGGTFARQLQLGAHLRF